MRLHGLDQEAAEIGAALPQHGDFSFEPPAVARPAPRCRAARTATVGEEQPQVEPRQHDDGADQEQHIADPGERRLRGDTLDFADIVVDARHDVAEPRPRVEARRQPVQVPVHLQPHVEQDVCRDARVAQPADHVQHEADERDAGESSADVRSSAAGRGRAARDRRSPREMSGSSSERPVLSRLSESTSARRRQVRRDEPERPAQVLIHLKHVVATRWTWASTLRPERRTDPR